MNNVRQLSQRQHIFCGTRLSIKNIRHIHGKCIEVASLNIDFSVASPLANLYVTTLYVLKLTGLQFAYVGGGGR